MKESTVLADKVTLDENGNPQGVDFQSALFRKENVEGAVERSVESLGRCTILMMQSGRQLAVCHGLAEIFSREEVTNITNKKKG